MGPSSSSKQRAKQRPCGWKRAALPGGRRPHFRPGQVLDWPLSPLVGGGQIVHGYAGGFHSCSAGFGVSITWENGAQERGFITAGHRAPEGSKLHTSRRDIAGLSHYNAYTRGGQLDVQYLRSIDPVLTGYVARPAAQNISRERVTGGMKTLDPERLYFSGWDAKNAAVGDLVSKVGRSTEGTSGQVTRSCVSTVVRGVTRQRRARCTDLSTLPTRGGDSGAPVFLLNRDGTVTARGILFTSPGMFAPVEQVIDEHFQRQDAVHLRLTGMAYSLVFSGS